MPKCSAGLWDEAVLPFLGNPVCSSLALGAQRGVPNSGCVLGVILGTCQEEAARVCAVPGCRCAKWAVSDDSPGSIQGWARWGVSCIPAHGTGWNQVTFKIPSTLNQSIISEVHNSLSPG